jgi:adenylate kinase
VQASTLIKNAREALGGQPIGHDRLRFADLGENQQLLIQGFEASVDNDTPLVVLDGHSIIERDGNYVLIDPAVFAAIGIRGMLFLEDEPSEITPPSHK